MLFVDMIISAPLTYGILSLGGSLYFQILYPILIGVKTSEADKDVFWKQSCI